MDRKIEELKDKLRDGYGNKLYFYEDIERVCQDIYALRFRKHEYRLTSIDGSPQERDIFVREYYIFFDGGGRRLHRGTIESLNNAWHPTGAKPWGVCRTGLLFSRQKVFAIVTDGARRRLSVFTPGEAHVPGVDLYQFSDFRAVSTVDLVDRREGAVCVGLSRADGSLSGSVSFRFSGGMMVRIESDSPSSEMRRMARDAVMAKAVRKNIRDCFRPVPVRPVRQQAARGLKP
jgi:hypothetical protein